MMAEECFKSNVTGICRLWPQACLQGDLAQVGIYQTPECQTICQLQTPSD